MKQDENDPNTIWMHTGDQVVMDQEGYLKSRFSWFVCRHNEKCLTFHCAAFAISYWAYQGGSLYPVVALLLYCTAHALSATAKDLIIRGGEVKCHILLAPKYRGS
jgi:acyl-CoA synthetase (AMP-forming)/AMP-acid ligase II